MGNEHNDDEKDNVWLGVLFLTATVLVGIISYIYILVFA